MKMPGPVDIFLKADDQYLIDLRDRIDKELALREKERKFRTIYNVIVTSKPATFTLSGKLSGQIKRVD